MADQSDTGAPSGELEEVAQEGIRLARIAKGKRPDYFADPATDKLLSMVMVLAQELAVTRDRLTTIEQLIEENGLFEIAKIDNYTLSDDQVEQRSERHTAFISKLLRTVLSELEALKDDAHSNGK
mgnify:CR=1 FL=1